MAESEQVMQGSEEPLERKIVSQYIQVQKIIEDLFESANRAEEEELRRPQYLSMIFDELSPIARVKCRTNEQAFKDLMGEWDTLEQDYGELDLKRFGRVDIKEWRERKRALTTLRERVGMGTSPPDAKKDLGPPLPMAAYWKCPDDCPALEEIRKQRKRYQ